jgi:tRNA pseudouridine38-40 synthase
VSVLPAVRVAVGIEYDGSRYRGWQSQLEAPTVQQEVERALGFVADHPVALTCAGRTDAGVHALAQVAHFDSPAPRSLRAWVLGANTRLPGDIALLWATIPAEGFHARYSALARSYRYLIHNRASRPALLRRRVCWFHPPLDEAAMHAAAQLLVGRHDFSAFRAAECQARSPVRELERIAVSDTANSSRSRSRPTPSCTTWCATSPARCSPSAAASARLTGCARCWRAASGRQAGITAPAGGLYLTEVRYPPEFGLPVAAVSPWAMIPSA